MTALNKKLLSIETEWNQAKSKLARDAAYKQLLEENNALQGKFFSWNYRLQKLCKTDNFV